MLKPEIRETLRYSVTYKFGHSAREYGETHELRIKALPQFHLTFTTSLAHVAPEHLLRLKF